MARGMPVEAPKAIEVPSAITASAMNMTNVSASPQAYRKDESWQRSAWDFYHSIGALNYAATVTGSVMSRARMSCVKKTTGDTGTKPGSGVGVAALKEFFGGPDGQSEMFKKVGTSLSVAGEFWTVATAQKDGGYEWFVLNTSEIQPSSANGAVWEMKGEDGQTFVPLPKGKSIVYRTWQGDPTDRMRATSAVRSMLPLLHRIRLLTQHIESQLQSRLTGNGILLLPSQMTPPKPPPGIAVPGNASPLDATTAVLTESMRIKITNPGSAEAQVPILFQVDGQYIKDIRLINFWSELDASVIEMLTAAYQEFAVGMNMPLETILGQGSSSHWNAWANDESYIKAHIEPALALVAGGVTKGYLQTIPGVDTADAVQVDTTDLRIRPDRSKDAKELYEMDLLSAEATLRDNGYGTEDQMGEEEIKRKLLLSVAKGQTTPFQVAAAQRMLGNDLPADPETNNQVEARPTPSIGNTPTQGPPDPADSEADGPNPFHALLAASEPVVFRALERAGNKLANNYIRTDQLKAIPASERFMAIPKTMVYDSNRLDFLLEGAWDCVPKLLGKYGDPTLITTALDEYTRLLLSERAPHTTEHLDAALSVRVQGMKGLMIKNG